MADSHEPSDPRPDRLQEALKKLRGIDAFGIFFEFLADRRGAVESEICSIEGTSSDEVLARYRELRGRLTELKSLLTIVGGQGEDDGTED